MRELRLVAEQWSQNAIAPSPAFNLVAGSGLNLNDTFSCPSPTCRRRQVDVLFRHAWHYFDSILLPDAVGHLLLNPPDGFGSEDLQREILEKMDIALYIQDLGANRLVQYYPTVHGTYGHVEASSLRQPAQWDTAWGAVEDSILNEASFSIKEIGEGTFSVRIDVSPNESDPIVEVQLSNEEHRNEDHLRYSAAHQVATDYMGALEDDMKLAHLLRGSFASTLWSHQRALSAMSKTPTPSNVAFHVNFPTLENVPINELIAIRSANGDAFLSFRAALTEAAKEMSANQEALSPEDIANQIKLDVIDPEIAKLNKRLSSAQGALNQKVATSIVLASVGTLCAAFFGLFPAAAAGAIGTAAAIANISKDASKYIDEKREIELSDMYFIWKSLKHAE